MAVSNTIRDKAWENIKHAILVAYLTIYKMDITDPYDWPIISNKIIECKKSFFEYCKFHSTNDQEVYEFISNMNTLTNNDDRI